LAGVVNKLQRVTSKMASYREEVLSLMSLDAVADMMSNHVPGSPHFHQAEAEFRLRETVAQISAAEAQEEAARAATATAAYTSASARYMKWSVIVLAAASVANLAVALGALTATLLRH
jgi:hypothetical protein